MRARGIDIAGRRRKHLDEFAGRRFDYVVSLCDRVREVCPEFPDGPESSTGACRTRPREPDGATASSAPPTSSRPASLPARTIATDAEAT